MRRLVMLLLLLTTAAHAQDKIAFGLDWTAEAEYGGFYQALATGAYERHGLAVTIRQGGPQVNQTQLLLAGRLDMTLASNGFLALNLVQQNIPFRAVGATFQTDPAVLIAHAGQGHDSFEQLRGQPIMIGSDSRVGWWPFLKQRFGYTDAQIRPYTFNLAPFLADPKAVQQGFLGSEPFSIKQATGEDPLVLRLSDAGFSGYGSLILAGDAVIDGKPDVMRRFIEASREGWESYLHGDPAPGNAAIKRDNPGMTDALLAYGREALLTHGIVDGGDAKAHGIFAMTDERWATFLGQTAGLFPPGLDVKRAYTLRFVNVP